MSAAAAALPRESSGAARAILWGGLLAGVGDITFAFVVWRGIGPVRVLQSVASGLLGAAAREGGAGDGGARRGAPLHHRLHLGDGLLAGEP